MRADVIDDNENNSRDLPATDELTLSVRGLHCASCVNTLEKKLLSNPSIKTAIVNLATETCFVSYTHSSITPADVFNIVHSAGYTPVEFNNNLINPPDNSLKKEFYWLLFSLLASAPIMLTMGMHSNRAAMQLSLVLATAIQFSAGLTFYRGSYNAIRNRSANMDLLVALGTSAAYFYSLAVFFGLFGTNRELFFETSAMLITFIRLGKYLESRARGKASEALRSLLHLQADKACLLTESGEKQIPASVVRVDDLILVRSGEVIPVDGEVIEGGGAVNESMISGESLPVLKKTGDFVAGGTTSTNGAMKIRVTRVGEATLLAQIVKMVREAQGDKAPIQRFADMVSAWFVPVVILLAIVTFAGWYFFAAADFITAFRFAIAVLVIACPCAMGLATPTAIMVGSGIALNRGILVKRGSALEAVAKVRILLLDKTGTITRGAPEMTDLLPISRKVDPVRLLECLAAAELYSTHPLAQAALAAARQSGIEPDETEQFEEHAGMGVTCIYMGLQLAVGNQLLMERLAIPLDQMSEKISNLAAVGKSLVFIAVDNRLIGIAGFADSIKTDSAEAIAKLRKMGITTCMITGDNPQAASAIAKQAGVDSFEAGVTPERKRAIVKEYQSRGLATGMVGDGINDAPALAQADVGIAIGAGTDVAKESGEIVLIKSNLADVVRAIAIGRATVSKIKQNLFWAFFYNILGIPVAAGLLSSHGILLKPEYAGLAMALSSVSVVVNSLFLKRIDKKL